MDEKERALLTAATTVMTIAFAGKAGAFDIGDHIDSFVEYTTMMIDKQEASPPTMLTEDSYKLVPAALDIIAAFGLEPEGEIVARILNNIMFQLDSVDTRGLT